jgi:hypothetical protein
MDRIELILKTMNAAKRISDRGFESKNLALEGYFGRQAVVKYGRGLVEIHQIKSFSDQIRQRHTSKVLDSLKRTSCPRWFVYKTTTKQVIRQQWVPQVKACRNKTRP